MDGSILITMATLLVLSVCAPASQAPADLSDTASSAANALNSAIAEAFDGSLVPAVSLSLALQPEPTPTTEPVPPTASAAGQPVAETPMTAAAASAATEPEAAEADPLPAAAAEQEASAPAASDPATQEVANAVNNSADTETTPGDTEADPTDPELMAETGAIAAEEFLDEQLQATDPLTAELLESAAEPQTSPTTPNLPTPAAMGETVEETVAVLESAATSKTKDAPLPEPFNMLGKEVQPGTMQRLTWNATEAFSGTTVPTPILVAHGVQKGPTLCLTAAVHGDELNGIETVRRIIHNVSPEKLGGTLIGVPIVNMAGFQRHSRYLPDRRDLNRFFPGNPGGSSASRIAYSFFQEVILQCDGLIDLHTGSFHRTNLPQLRANLNNEAVVKLTEGFGSTIILHSDGGIGTLRRAAVEAGIPAVTLEAGEPLRLQDDEVKHSVKGIYTLLETLGMYDKRGIRGGPEPVYYTSEWVRADTGGILFSRIKLGKRIKRDDLLGTVTDPISNEQEEIRSPFSGRVIGMALNQFVMPGFATYHIGIEAEDAEDAKQDEEPVILTHDVAFEPDMEVVEE